LRFLVSYEGDVNSLPYWSFEDYQCSRVIRLYYNDKEHKLFTTVGPERQWIESIGRCIDVVPVEIYIKDLLLAHPVALYVRKTGLKLC